MVASIQDLGEFISAVRLSGGNSEHPASFVIIDFSATWCGPCKRIAPIYHELSEKYPSISFFKVDVQAQGIDEATEIYKITSLPTFCVFHNNNCVERLCGADEGKLREIVHRYANMDPDTVLSVEPAK